MRLGLGGGVTGSRLSIELWEIEVKFVTEEEKDEALCIEVLYGENLFKLEYSVLYTEQI
jgi:hypothetical protein